MRYGDYDETTATLCLCNIGQSNVGKLMNNGSRIEFIIVNHNIKKNRKERSKLSRNYQKLVACWTWDTH